jgi:hypothetical protein
MADVDPFRRFPAGPRPQAAGTFRDYVMTRKYDFGRGSRDAWRFIAFARGDRDFPDPASWRELEAYVRRSGLADEFAGPARAVWRSFIAHRSRIRRAPAGPAGRAGR